MTSLYYYPNRPILIPPDPDNPLQPKPDYINGLEKEGRYIAEQKYNGDNCLIYVKTKVVNTKVVRYYEFWNRHKEQLKYQPSPEVQAELEQIPDHSIINVELIHSKTKEFKHILMAHCVMAWDGKLLTGQTWGDSRQILTDNIKSGEHLYVSDVYQEGFWDLYKQADGATIEGIILKDPEGKLVYSTTPIKDQNWMMKIRVPSMRPDGTMKKYGF